MAFILFYQIGVTYVHAENSESTLLYYEEKLQELNNEFGTKYKLVPDKNSSYDKILSMTIDEFEQYIRDAYNADIVSRDLVSTPTLSVTPSYSARASDSVQRYYYNGISSLYIKTKTTTVMGKTIYSDVVNAGSESNGYYPSYDAYDWSVGLSVNKEFAYANFKCLRYITENVIDGADYSVDVTFTAGGGNLYPYA